MASSKRAFRTRWRVSREAGAAIWADGLAGQGAGSSDGHLSAVKPEQAPAMADAPAWAYRAARIGTTHRQAYLEGQLRLS